MTEISRAASVTAEVRTAPSPGGRAAAQFRRRRHLPHDSRGSRLRRGLRRRMHRLSGCARHRPPRSRSCRRRSRHSLRGRRRGGHDDRGPLRLRARQRRALSVQLAEAPGVLGGAGHGDDLRGSPQLAAREERLRGLHDEPLLGARQADLADHRRAGGGRQGDAGGPAGHRPGARGERLRRHTRHRQHRHLQHRAGHRRRLAHLLVHGVVRGLGDLDRFCKASMWATKAPPPP